MVMGSRAAGTGNPETLLCGPFHQTITGQVLEGLQLRKCSAQARRPSKQHVAGSNPAWDPSPCIDWLLGFDRPCRIDYSAPILAVPFQDHCQGLVRLIEQHVVRFCGLPPW